MKIEKAILVLNGQGFWGRGFLAALEDDPGFVIAVDGGICYRSTISTLLFFALPFSV